MGQTVLPHTPALPLRLSLELRILSVLQTVGAMIEAARLERGMSQTELSRRLGVSRSTVIALEKGTAKVSEGTVFEAATIVGILMEIESNVEALAELGVRQEICAVATRVLGIDNKTILPGLTLVGDGFISLIGYQAQGYHLATVF